MARKKTLEMEIINSNCAGIDIGSKSHYVAVGQALEDVCEFGVYAEDLTSLCLHLKSFGITSVAMESTGDYWQNLYAELLKYGFDVILCNGKFTKHAKGKKTDVKDCRWIQKLHSLGLLTGSFLPDEQTEILRTYCRQRTNWLDLAASASRKMQKYLKFLNFRLDVVVKDVCGLTGLKIIEDICKGNLDPNSKMFTSWARLAPNNKISGGKVLSNRILKGSGRLKIALRNAANAIGNLKDTHLSDFFRRVAFRKGRQAAVSATARKLAVILWTMATKKVPYSPPKDYLFLDQKRKMKLGSRIKQNIVKFDIKPEDVGFCFSSNLSTEN